MREVVQNSRLLHVLKPLENKWLKQAEAAASSIDRLTMTSLVTAPQQDITHIVVACDESGAKGYADRDESLASSPDCLRLMT
jgi:hypothetical protein